MAFEWFEVALAAAFLAFGAAAVVLLGAFRSAAANTGGVEDDRGSKTLAVVKIDQRGVISTSRGARALLGGFSGPRLDIKTLAARFKNSAAFDTTAQDFEAALRRLVSDGVAFRLGVETKAGRYLKAVGEPRGARIAVHFQDETDLWRDLLSAKAAAEAEAEARAARETALDVASGLAWIADAGGRTTWRSAALNATDDRMQALLLKIGDRPAADFPVTVDVGKDRFEAQRVALSDAQAYFTAKKVEQDGGGDTAFSRFVNTMSETFAHLKVGLMIFDQERRLTLFNPATARLLAADPTWLARRPTLKEILDRMREARSIPEQTDYVGWRDALLARSALGMEADWDESWHLPDGRSIHIIARPHPSGGLAMTVEDISESVALMRSNAAERAVLHAATEFLEEALIVFGPDGRSRVVNEAFQRLWGFEEDAFQTPRHIRDIAEWCASQLAKGGYWTIALDAATGGSSGSSHREKLELASGRVVVARFSPMPDGSALLVFSDITASERVAAALRERNEALEHADEVRGALVDQISHQMRTPLNAVFGFGQLLGDERFGALNPRQREYVDGIVSSSTELLDAINGMTDLITVGSDSMSLGGELLDPVETLREVIDLASRRFEGRSSLIETRNCGVEGKFRAHKVRLRQIVFNMLMDALTKSEPGGKIEIGLELTDRVLVLRCAHAPSADMEDRGRLAIALIRRFAGLHGGEVDIVTNKDGLRELICHLPECEEAPVQASLLIEETLAVAE